MDRLESLDQIRQLPAKYALSLDMRDVDAMANLFVDDVGVPGKQRGRQALKCWYAETMRQSPGCARSVPCAYLDRYERRDGVWYFQRRTPLYWYETDMTRRRSARRSCGSPATPYARG